MHMLIYMYLYLYHISTKHLVHGPMFNHKLISMGFYVPQAQMPISHVGVDKDCQAEKGSSLINKFGTVSCSQHTHKRKTVRPQVCMNIITKVLKQERAVTQYHSEVGYIPCLVLYTPQLEQTSPLVSQCKAVMRYWALLTILLGAIGISIQGTHKKLMQQIIMHSSIVDSMINNQLTTVDSLIVQVLGLFQILMQVDN